MHIDASIDKITDRQTCVQKSLLKSGGIKFFLFGCFYKDKNAKIKNSKNIQVNPSTS